MTVSTTYVLSHDHLSLEGSEVESDLLDLLGGNVVHVNDDGLVELEGHVLESLPVVFLLDSLLALFLAHLFFFY